MEKFEIISVKPDEVTQPNGRGPASISRSYGSELPPPNLGAKREYGGILEYWQMVRRHQGMVLLAIALGLVAGYVRTLPEKRIYQARTSLEIQGMNEDFMNMKNVSP